MGWHFIEADATVTLHVLPAVDLEVTVGVDRDQDWTNVGLGGSEEESQNFLPEAPDPSFPLSPASVFPCRQSCRDKTPLGGEGTG